MFDIEASKNVKDLATLEKSAKFRKTVVDHPTSEQKGNVNQRNWPYDSRALRQLDACIYII